MEAEPAESTGNPCKIFVGNLPFKMTQDGLAALFRQFGDVVGSKMVEDRSTGKKKGFGFVTFEQPHCVDLAIERMHDEECQGRRLTVKRATARGEKAEEEASHDAEVRNADGEDGVADDDGFSTAGPARKRKVKVDTGPSFKARADAKKDEGKMLGWGEGDDDWA